MERKNIETIGDVLRAAIEESRMTGRLDECRAADAFREILGPQLASRCLRPFVKNGVMIVGIPNASLRNELSMSRSALTRAINSRLGKNVISEIRFSGRGS